MANEARLTCSLVIQNGNLVYQSQPPTFLADVGSTQGPSPGLVVATDEGTIVDLSLVSEPGLCRIANTSDSGYIVYGIWYPDASLFFPLGECLPGESYILRLWRWLGQEFLGTGTGTTGSGNSLMIKSVGGPCFALVEAFQK